MADDVAALAARLLEAVSADEGSIPQRIIVEPNGVREVNVRAGYRDRTHPVTYHKGLDRDIKSHKR